MSKKDKGRAGAKAPAGSSLKMSPEDLALLTAEEIRGLEAEAESEATDEHKEQIKLRVKSAFKAAKKKALAGDAEVDEPTRHIVLDLAPHAERITLDGRVFFHGGTYEVTDSVYRTLSEIQSRGWAHENEVGNANQGAYRRPRHTVIGPNQENVAASALMRV